MVIGIGGASRSGKSSLAAFIHQFYTGSIAQNGQKGEQKALILSQDDYVFPIEKIPKIYQNQEEAIDWESPESIDFKKYKTAIIEATKQFELVITEGLLNFYDEDLNTLFDKFLFVDISKQTFLRRKAADKRWGEVPEWYIAHIWLSYERFGKTILEQKKREILLLSGEKDFDAESIIHFLSAT